LNFVFTERNPFFLNFWICAKLQKKAENRGLRTIVAKRNLAHFLSHQFGARGAKCRKFGGKWGK
jgi:hypothetical protein